MNLYLVTCVSSSKYTKESIGVYVVAASPNEAENGALSLIRNLQWKYDDRAEKIELIASVNTHRADHLLMIAI